MSIRAKSPSPCVSCGKVCLTTFNEAVYMTYNEHVCCECTLRVTAEFRNFMFLHGGIDDSDNVIKRRQILTTYFPEYLIPNSKTA